MKYCVLSIVTGFLSILPLFTNGQEHLFELNVRGTGVLAPVLLHEDDQKDNRDFAAIGYNVEVLYFFKDFAGAGIFYARDFSSFAKEFDSGNSSYGLYPAEIEGDATFVMYGASGQITTSRQRRFRIYGVVRIFKMEVVDDYTEFSIGKSGTGYSAGFGVGMKITKWMTLNLFELSYMGLSKGLDYGGDKGLGGVMGNSGLTFKILRKK